MKSIDEINEGHMSLLRTPQPVVFSPQMIKLFERLVVAAERQALVADQQLEMMKESVLNSPFSQLREENRKRPHFLARDDDSPERTDLLQTKADALHDAIDRLKDGRFTLSQADTDALRKAMTSLDRELPSNEDRPPGRGRE
jgi:hypothetical protein